MQNIAKNIQLCGIGNGVVDMQFQVSDEIFNTLNVPKGEMRLVEIDQQLSIIEKLKGIIPNKCSGGSATNSIESFAKFGGKSAFLTVVGDDEYGKFYYNELSNSSIEFKNNIIQNKNTGTCLVLITPDGERTMLTCLAASKEFSLEHLDEKMISRSEWLYIEGYKFSETTGAECIKKSIEIAKKNNTKIAISASDVFIIEIFNEPFMAALKQADLLFCNENEAKAITKCNDFEKNINTLASICPNVVMTRGGNGSVVYWNDEQYIFNGIQRNVIDTTGAGDMFAGAFLFGLLNPNKIENHNQTLNKNNNIIWNSGKLATLASSLIVEQLGARYSGNYDDILKEVN
jgi:sugar/nucleoside kinase (ribokinase family)